MPLTETQAKLLGVLAALMPTQTLTTKQLCSRTGFAMSTVKASLNTHLYDGLVQTAAGRSGRWRIFRRGRAVLSAPIYREFWSQSMSVENGVER